MPVTGLRLRPAHRADLAVLRRWDEAPHVQASDPNDDWRWEDELGRSVPWREQLIVELGGRPIGYVEIIDPSLEEQHYWGRDVAPNQRAVDVWIGEVECLDGGLGTATMRQALARCFGPADVDAVLIDPLAGNVRAQRFYARLGFRPVGPRRFGDDDCLVMRLGRDDWEAWEAAAHDQRIAEVVDIEADIEQVWDALTNPDVTQRYWYDTRIESDWQVGSRIRYVRHGELTDEHTVLEIEPPRRLVHTFRPRFGIFRDEAPSQVSLTLAAHGRGARLDLLHDGFPPHSQVYPACRGGWPSILSSLKTLLETGDRSSAAATRT